MRLSTCFGVIEVPFIDKDPVEDDGAGSFHRDSEGRREGQFRDVSVDTRQT